MMERALNRLCVHVIANPSGVKQSGNDVRMDCFAPLAMTIRRSAPRNDVKRIFVTTLMKRNISKDDITDKVPPFKIKEDTDNIYILDYAIPKRTAKKTLKRASK